MKNIFLKSLLVLSIGYLTACQKVIDLPLNNADSEIVVEAVGKNLLGHSYVKLSKTGSVYENTAFEKLAGASVTITDQDGLAFVFSETETGTYLNADFSGNPNTNYVLDIAYEDLSINTNYLTPSIPHVDTVWSMESVGGLGVADDTTYQAFYTVTDNGDERNYYRFVVWVNGVKDDNYYLQNDDLGNGQTYTASFYNTTLYPKDTVYAELWALNETLYTYFTTLANNQNQGPFSAAPSNPTSNITDGLGYFGIFMVDTVLLIMP